MTLVAAGGDPATGLLVNRTVGQRPFDPPDVSRPTVVFAHGVNPGSAIVHFTMAQRLAEALARRYGAGAFTVLEWDWNATTIVSHRQRENTKEAIEQGQRLGATLLAAGFDPARLHFVGQSAGSMVVASATRTIVGARGVRVAQITCLDAATFTHDAVFRELSPGSYASRVENYWASGLSAFGGTSGVPGVVDIQVPQDASIVGLVIPTRSAHLGVVSWYVDTIGDPSQRYGFNQSLLLGR